MRLHALLLAGALLLLPTATAATATLAINGAPNAATDLTTNATKVLALTIHLKLSGVSCTAADKITVPLTVNSTGNASSSLDVKSVTFDLPAVSDQGQSAGSDITGDKGVNLTLTRTAAGWGNTTLTATYDGTLPASCSGFSIGPPPDTSPPAKTSANATLASAYFGPAVSPTPSATVTASPSPTATTSASPSATASTSPSPAPSETPTPADSGHKLLPAPGVISLVGALAVALLVLRRKA